MLRTANPCAPRTHKPQLCGDTLQVFISLAWLLAFTESFASLVISVVNKPNTLTMLSQQKFNTKVTICWCANNNFME